MQNRKKLKEKAKIVKKEESKAEKKSKPKASKASKAKKSKKKDNVKEPELVFQNKI